MSQAAVNDTNDYVNFGLTKALSYHPLFTYQYLYRTYGLPQFAARIGNAYSSTNGDLVNTNLTDTDIQQNLASDEYLDEKEETKDVRAWARAGLNFTTLLDYMPPRMTDTLNQILVDMILVSVLVYSLLYTISRGFIILFLHLAYHDIVLSH